MTLENLVAYYRTIPVFLSRQPLQMSCIFIPGKSVVTMVWDDVIHQNGRCERLLLLLFSAKWMFLFEYNSVFRHLVSLYLISASSPIRFVLYIR